MGCSDAGGQQSKLAMAAIKSAISQKDLKAGKDPPLGKVLL